MDLTARLLLNDNLSPGLRQALNAVNRLNGGVSSVGRNSGIGTLVGAVATLTAGLGSALGAAKLLDATIGEAMRFEQSEVLVGAILDDKKLTNQYTQMVQKMAEASPILDSSGMMGNSKAFLGITKSMPELEKAWGIAEKLSIMDPEQGLEGAVYAMKELAAGDGVSMADRFEMPKSVVNDIKKLNFDEQLVAMEKYLDTTGITSKTVEAMGNTTLSKWNQIKEKLTTTFRTMGTEGNSVLGDAMDGFLSALDSGAFDALASVIENGLGTAIKNVTSWIGEVDWANVADTATTAFNAIATTVGTVSSFVISNFTTIKNTLLVVGYSVLAIKMAMLAMGAVNAVITTITVTMGIFKATITAVRSAQLLLNLAMTANPIGLVITAVAALVAVGILLYKNWDRVTAGLKQAWDSMKNGQGVILTLMGPVGFLIKAAIDLAKNWDSTKSVWDNVWGAMKRSAADTVNTVISGINSMIDLINKLPGVNIPIVAKVDWGNDGAGSVASRTYTNGPANTGGGTAHALGNHAGLGEVHGTTIRKLHDGERVLTAVENKALKQQTREANNAEAQTPAQTTNNIAPIMNFAAGSFVVREEADVEKIAGALAGKIASYA